MMQPMAAAVCDRRLGGVPVIGSGTANCGQIEMGVVTKKANSVALPPSRHIPPAK